MFLTIGSSSGLHYEPVNCKAVYILGLPNKFTAGQARSISHYKNLRTKVMNCHSNIYFSLQCLIKEVVPRYASINIVCDPKKVCSFTVNWFIVKA